MLMEKIDRLKAFKQGLQICRFLVFYQGFQL